MRYTFDSGALIALERRKQRAVHLLATGHVTVPAPCFAEWWRGRTDHREDIRRAIVIDWLDERILRVAGEVLAAIRPTRTTRSLTIDAMAIASAATRKRDVLVTSDVDDMQRLQAFFPGVRVLGV